MIEVGSMRRFALATIPTLLLFGCTRHDDESAKALATLKSELDAAKKELAETKSALRTMEDALRERLSDPEHRAADWALASGGALVVRVGDRPVEVRTAGELPTEHFQILQMQFKSNHKIDDDGLKALKGLSHIRTLDLFDTKIGDPALASIAQLTSLEGLTLRDTQVTDAGVAKLTRLSNLKLLDLVGTSVTPAMARTLQTLLPKCKIDTVDKK
jgi:Leucine-rich repeat (LRR) protein